MGKFLHYITIFILVSASTFTAQGQNWEYGVLVGGSNYHGDLAFNIVPKETHFAQGVHIRYNFTPYWSYRPSIVHAKISGSDANFSDYKFRNLSFESDIWEVNNMLEFNFLPFGSRILSKDFSSYVTLGLTVFRHNPKAIFNDQTFALRDLRTEGQSSKEQYGLIQLAIPFGGGVKYNVNKNLVIGLEVAWRKTFTDYLDDASTVYPDLQEQRDQFGTVSANMSDRSWEVEGVGEPLSVAGDERGDPGIKDFYFIAAFSITYRLTPIACWPKHKRDFIWK
ncbi:MAG: opacity protein-like surface antigen [Bacteroidia bacterium]|jgi:opacity protein-like surface antigen